MYGVDDSGAAASKTTMNRLCILQIGIHQRGGIEKPRAQVPGSVDSVAFFFGKHPGSCKRGDLQAQPNHRVTMGNEVVRVGHAIALDVRAVRVLGIGPPVITFGKVIVLASGASWT